MNSDPISNAIREAVSEALQPIREDYGKGLVKIDNRFEAIEKHIGTLAENMNDGFREVNQRIQDISNNRVKQPDTDQDD